MSYNRHNILKRIIEIQDITLEHTNKGVTQVWVYNNIIYPRFVISEKTYYNYLCYNAKAGLKEYERKEKLKGKQLSLF